MGNLTTREYTYQTYNAWICDGFEYLQNHASIWTGRQRECLLNFLKIIKQTDFKQSPWVEKASILEEMPELFNRVKLAVPKTIKTAKIYAYTQTPKFNSTSGGITRIDSQSIQFDNLTPDTQIYLAHVYTLVMFMWAHHQEESPLTYFYKSDVLHYAFQKENPSNPDEVIDYSQIECFMESVEKISRTNENLDAFIESAFPLQSKRHLAPLGKIIDKLDGEMGIARSDSSSMSTANSEKCVKCWQKGVAGKHFLQNPPLEDSLSSSASSSPSSTSEIDTVYVQPTHSVYREARKKHIRPMPHHRIQCGGSATTIEYLDEILAKLDLICEYHGLI